MESIFKSSVILVCAGLIAVPVLAQEAMRPANALSLVDGLEGVFGSHAGFRRSGAKGICATGVFIGNSEGAALSKSSAFSGKAIPVILRFSVGGGNPKAPENARSVRGLAVKMDLPGNEQWLMANISAPFFTAATPDGFQAFLDARRPDPATGKPNPEAIAAAAAKYPDFKPQADWLKANGVPASYGAINYWGVHAFKLSSPKGNSRFVRWTFEPVTGQEFIPDDKLSSTPTTFLADELRARVSQKPVEFNFRFQLAEDGDVTNNATVAWASERKVITAGRLVVNSVEADGSASCDAINFNPLSLPAGIEASNDPLLAARAGSYAVSQSRRLTK